ncbi:hypothetical protein K2173_001246 [Erythroxylum novogranatense]|uniref:Cytochrome b561 domain-containing protein n=1 Tax=Erythroxylum novogranatense TaxID=1862640 RepID=A0AAV8T4K4_9ROSI|nr:hypothetical protein K2173_001246 [Erythroxylum novogranatense]
MNVYWQVILVSLTFYSPSITAESSSCNVDVSLLEADTQNHAGQVGDNIFVHEMENGVTTNLRSPKRQRGSHPKHPLKSVPLLLNIIGWGTLLPLGAIVARSFRKSPLKCEEWYNIHILCQTLGYVVGALGWATGILLGRASKQHNSKAHRILDIVIFTFASVQMLGLCLQPKREDEFRRVWEICHHVLGYALIAMIITNIFIGVGQQGHAEKWKWAYVGFLVLLFFTALALEIFRRVKHKSHLQQMPLQDNFYTTT